MDWAYHVEGKGSLGNTRYICLVKKHSNNKYYLVDLKKATPSCLQPYVTTHQPKWINEADRIIQIQKRVQGKSPALLHSFEVESESYILREYQSGEAKVRYDKCSIMIDLENVVKSMVQISAW